MTSEKALIVKNFRSFFQKNFRLSDLNNFLTCVLCDGYFRFAHTVAECGHTFCRECLKINKPKNCPVCGIPLSSTVISKDPFKQHIVDLLYPSYQMEDQKVLKRMKELFGDGIDEIEINNLLAQKDYTHQTKKKKIKLSKQESNALSIVDLVNYYLNISFDEFKKDIYDENKFEGYSKIMVEKRKQEAANCNRQTELADIQSSQLMPVQNIPLAEMNEYIINLQPQGESDFAIANLNCVIKLLKKDDQHSSIIKIRRFILKTIKSKKSNDPKLISNGNINTENVTFTITKIKQIFLYYNEKILKDSDSLKEIYVTLPLDKQITIRYEILVKK